MAKMANTRWGLSLRDRDLKKLGRDNVGEHLLSSTDCIGSHFGEWICDLQDLQSHRRSSRIASRARAQKEDAVMPQS